jgi:bifunctional diaminopimelate decarboxylase / aspartate kinase
MSEISHGPTWVVLKFGGTSVATAERWRTIAGLVERRIAEGLRPLVVCSALAGVSNRLESMLELAVAGGHEEALEEIRRRHLELGGELGLPAADLLAPELEELSRLALAAALLRDAGPPLKARVMALGELLSTRLGAAFLNAQGIPTAWLDARTALVCRDEPHARAARAYLSASCTAERDPELAARLTALPAAAVLTQGFIAGNASGETVLLGRGGSDTSAAYFAAKLGAARCEIWTDVPGMFTANPALLPSARLLRALGYDEAQEIATTGAKVLHPRSIPPLARHRIPLHVLATDRPEAPGTIISAAGSDGDPQIKAISSRRGLTLISMETVGMWQEVGFLAEIFACFARHGLSIDAVSTSETNVTVSLDPNAQAIEPTVIRDLLRDLAHHCEPRVIAPTASISLVGPGIRGILHELGHLLELFAELSVYLVTQSASDLNLTFFVDEEQSERLVRQFHGRLFGHRAESASLGPTWSELYDPAATVAGAPEWWQRRRAELLDLAAREAPVYVYDEETLEEAAEALLALPSVDRLFYSLKANHHPGVLAVFHRLGLGFECVSVPEIEHLLALFPDLNIGGGGGGGGERLLYTPNFASREELARGFALGARVTIDSLHPIVAWPDLLAGRDLFLRLDPGRGRGHHPYVRTAGGQSKFGIAPDQTPEVAERLAEIGARVVGLHAHAGSGIQTPEAWGELAVFLGAAAERFPDVRVLDVGGGLGVPERHGQGPLDLAALEAGLARFKAAYAVHPARELWLEPGRFLVAQAGVLLARVTQVKRKGETLYVGVETGMNSLIRPALYGAYHTIVNLSRLDEPPTQLAHVVGPICETGDVLGRSRRLVPTAEGDVLLIANAGAYGRVMSSRYNLREPAGERLLQRPGLTS